MLKDVIKFMFDNVGNLEFKSCVADEDGKVISITIDEYQVNVGDNIVYLIDENGRHQSLQLLRNQETPDFEVSANGLLTYMQYDSKKDVRLVIRYDQDVYGDNGRVYVDYLNNPFYVSVESKPKLRDKGLVFLGKKDSYYRLDFDVWNNKWQYDLATIGEYGFGAVMTSDTISLHGGEKEFSRYYRELLSVGDYFSLTTFPLGKAYKKNDIDLIADLRFLIDFKGEISETSTLYEVVYFASKYYGELTKIVDACNLTSDSKIEAFVDEFRHIQYDPNLTIMKNVAFTNIETVKELIEKKYRMHDINITIFEDDILLLNETKQIDDEEEDVDLFGGTATAAGKAENRRVEVYILPSQQMIESANAGTLK